MEQNDKYEERVRQRAEQIARVHHDARIKQYNLTGIARRKEWDNLHADHRAMLTREFMPAARLAVRWEAEAFGEGFEDAESIANGNSIYGSVVYDLLHERGLIPSPEKTKG